MINKPKISLLINQLLSTQINPKTTAVEIAPVCYIAFKQDKKEAKPQQYNTISFSTISEQWRVQNRRG